MISLLCIPVIYIICVSSNIHAMNETTLDASSLSPFFKMLLFIPNGIKR